MGLLELGDLEEDERRHGERVERGEAPVQRHPFFNDPERLAMRRRTMEALRGRPHRAARG